MKASEIGAACLELFLRFCTKSETEQRQPKLTTRLSLCASFEYRFYFFTGFCFELLLILQLYKAYF